MLKQKEEEIVKENDQSRYIRWGIPGWMMFISLIGYLVIDIIFTHKSNENEIFLFIKNNVLSIGNMSSASSAIVALFVVAAGIPLGFLIYQFYFYIRWNSPFSRDGLFPPFVVGRWQDLERTMDGIKDEQISDGIPWRVNWISDPEFKYDHGGRWRYIENYFIEILQNLMMKSNAIDLFARYRYLLELLHTLGAGLFGVYLGYIGYLITKVKIYSFSLSVMLFICAIPLAALIFLLDVEDRLKKGGRKDNIELNKIDNIIHDLVIRIPSIRNINLSVIYLFFWGSFLYTGSPSPAPLAKLYGLILFRLGILSIPVVVWLLTNNKDTRKLRIVEIGLLIITVVLATPTSLLVQRYISPASWTFGWVTYSFLILNTIFIKNRQNTRDDLIALQNYSLKKYLFSSNSENEKKVNNIENDKSPVTISTKHQTRKQKHNAKNRLLHKHRKTGERYNFERTIKNRLDRPLEPGPRLSC